MAGVGATDDKLFKTSEQGLTDVQQGRQSAGRRERILTGMEAQLGTAEQVAGFDETVTSDREVGVRKRGREAGKAAGQFTGAEWASRKKRLNRLATKADEARAAGDMALAEQLDAKAQRVAKRTRGLTYRKTEEAAAAEALNSPIAKTVGSLVKDSAELMTEEGRASFMSDMTSDAIDAVKTGEQLAVRRLSAAEGEAKRAMRDIGLAVGGNPAQRMAVASQVSQQFAGQQADTIMQASMATSQIMSQASQFYETYSRSFAQNTAAFAQAFLQNSGGVRDAFRQEVLAYKQLSQGAYQAQMQALDSIANRQLQEKMFDKQQAAEMTGMALGFTSSMVGSGAGVGAAFLCYGAAVYFGWFTPDWFAARAWITRGFPAAFPRLGTAFLAFYRRHSATLAGVLRRSAVLRAAARPFFTWAANSGRRFIIKESN